MTRPTALRAALLLTVIVIAAYAYETGLFESLQAERLESMFREFGAWGPVLYVALFALLEAFFVPGIVFVAGGGLVWDWPALFVLSLLGATGAAIVGYGFARTIGHDFVQKRLSGRAHSYDAALARNGFRTVVTLRLIFFIAPWMNWLLGLSKVRFRDFLLGTIVGFAPAMVALTWVGSRGMDLFAERPLLGAAVGLAIVAAIVFWGRAFHRRVQVDLELAAADELA